MAVMYQEDERVRLLRIKLHWAHATAESILKLVGD